MPSNPVEYELDYSAWIFMVQDKEKDRRKTVRVGIKNRQNVNLLLPVFGKIKD